MEGDERHTAAPHPIGGVRDQAVRGVLQLRHRALPTLARLYEETGENITLAVLDRRSFLALAAGLVLLAGCSPSKKPEAAAPAAPPTGRDAGRVETGDIVTGLMSQTFNGEQQGRILNMGYYMAASALCSDLEVDAQKLGRSVEATLALEPAQAGALAAACAGPSWQAGELPLPTAAERREPASGR